MAWHPFRVMAISKQIPIYCQINHSFRSRKCICKYTLCFISIVMSAISGYGLMFTTGAQQYPDCKQVCRLYEIYISLNVFLNASDVFGDL